jgi:MinD-like ATPase involved in chromosome partitioning or flagellar assembly
VLRAELTAHANEKDAERDHAEYLPDRDEYRVFKGLGDDGVRGQRRGTGRSILIDLPSALDEATLAAIDIADVVCVVTAPHLAALRATTDLLATLSRVGKSPDRTIVTCVRIRPKGIDDAACAKFLKRKIDVVVPYAEKADAAADLDVPYVLAEKKDPTSLAITQLGTKLGSFKPVLA